ncbi:cation:proton antiporter [Aliiroseovarius subalbicans]|uniref:cation:proton antiporter domain-containing protein n=1 Tax=Aliiroseovarius subalbicans TaxID=2925840 RepID=UPI001F591D67|nr:cation:proton antiporter [Aliiroseovarius subalbicans]MCI2398086.1 cation:proton antiporter [Aliiroseovarius subalbicans]
MESFLFQATIYLGAAVIAVPIASRLRLGSVLGYLLAGLVIGPLLGLVGSETQDLQHFAEFGVVMMLFLIGLELEPRALWDMRHRLLGLGGLQITLTMTLVTAALLAVGQGFPTALAIGMMLALSSTAIVLQTLTEKGLMPTGGGRSSFSVLLTQDIAVIPMLAVLPLLSAGQVVHDADHVALSLVDGLPGWGVTLVTLSAVGAVILAGKYLIRPLFFFIDAARLREMHTAFALLIVVGIAVVMNMVGLSPALGTFMAGVVLANSEFRHELESDLQPFKGLLLGLFFITVGAGINMARFLENPGELLALTLSLMAVKGAVLFGLALAFGLKGRDRWLFTLGLAQAGEFGFVLVSFSLGQGVIAPGLANELLLVITLSMLLTPLFFIFYDILSKYLSEHRPHRAPDKIKETHRVIIIGIGRFGQVVNRLVRSAGFQTTVLDNDLETIQLMRGFGVKSFYGDPTRPDLLNAAGLATARVLVVTVNDHKAATRIVRHARQQRPDLHIVVRARDRAHVFALYKAGANDIVRELFDSSLRAGRYALENIGLSDFEASEAERMYFKHDRYAVRELAHLWDPNTPIEENEGYVQRSMELEKDMETALLTKLFGEDLDKGDKSGG